jgi:hypothetical protein
MKTKLFLVLLIALTINLYKSQDTINISKSHKFIGFSPSKKTQNVNILIKYFDEIDGEIKPKKVNGLGLGLNIIGIFLPPLVLFNAPFVKDWSFADIESNIPLPEKMNKINGLQFSFINMKPTTTNGLEISLSSNISAPSKINGVSYSPIFNIHHTTNGITIATFANISQKCRGIQVGLINSCKDSRGIQIGFWNVNEKRKMPIINWNFKTKKS